MRICFFFFSCLVWGCSSINSFENGPHNIFDLLESYVNAQTSKIIETKANTYIGRPKTGETNYYLEISFTNTENKSICAPTFFINPYSIIREAGIFTATDKLGNELPHSQEIVDFSWPEFEFSIITPGSTYVETYHLNRFYNLSELKRIDKISIKSPAFFCKKVIIGYPVLLKNGNLPYGLQKDRKINPITDADVIHIVTSTSVVD